MSLKKKSNSYLFSTVVCSIVESLVYIWYVLVSQLSVMSLNQACALFLLIPPPSFIIPVPTPESWASAVPSFTTCLQGQPECLGERQPSETEGQGRPTFGVTSSETWRGKSWRRGRSCGACILQIRAIHHLYTQDGLFNTPLTWPWLLELGKCVCATHFCVSDKAVRTFFFFLWLVKTVWTFHPAFSCDLTKTAFHIKTRASSTCVIMSVCSCACILANSSAAKGQWTVDHISCMHLIAPQSIQSHLN